MTRTSDPMRVVLKRGRDGPATLACVRADGSRTWSRLHPFFPTHDLLHYALESALGFRAAFFGLVASGWDIDDFAQRGAARRMGHEAGWAENLVALLDQERAGGRAWSEEDYNAAARAMCARQGLPEPPTVSAARLEAIRRRHRDLVDRWMATAGGETLELVFPGEEGP